MNAKLFWAFMILCFTATGSHAETWTNYFGAHYKGQEWGNSIRDPYGPGRLASALTNDNLNQIRTTTNTKDIIYGIDGLGSGRNQDRVTNFIQKMKNNCGADWKDQITKNAQKLKTLSPQHNIYWQFGNEINSQRFNETLLNALKQNGKAKGHNDTTIAPYVEYYLAPGIEALNKARPHRVNIVLGSVASFANPHAQRFLDTLLNYTIQGTCAGSLKGKHVYEIVDIISVHYITSANTPSWRNTLNTTKEKWVDSKKVSGIWSTEELGIQRARANAGAVFSAEIFARYMDWWTNQNMTPAQGRAFLWGSDVGSNGKKGQDGMAFLYSTLGKNAALLPIPKKHYSISGDNLEYYAFSDQNSKQNILFIFPKNQRQSAKIDSIYLPKSSYGIEQKFLTSGNNAPQSVTFKSGRSSEKITLPATSAWIVTYQN